ncbi:MAG: TRAP transporter substrate-binding protein [Oscillospiraceae bacterium]|nr:TRAP transporter substrate-binding protein [Oscillospiraceae bacterium]
MKRKLALILALVLVIGVLAACGAEPAPAPSTPAPGTSTPAPAPSDTPAAPPVDDTVYTLTVQSHDSQASATGQFLDALAAKINEASNGRIEFNIYHGGSLGGPLDTIDMTTNGTVDIGWGLQSFYAGLFPKSEIIMQPMVAGLNNAETGSKVFWDLYSNYDYLKAEYSDYHVLLLHTNCQCPITTATKQINTVEDLKGLNFRATAGGPTNFTTNFGGSPLNIPIGQLYSALQNNTVDGSLTDWHAIHSFQLFEVADYYMDINVGVMSYFMLMNQDSYNKLPADLQAIMDEYCNNAADWCPEYWFTAEKTARAAVNDIGGTIYTMDDAETAKLQAIADTTVQQWIEATEDGQAIYDTTVELIAKYAK